MADQPAAEIAQFQETGDPAALQRAAELLERMDVRAAADLAGRRELRRSALDGWVSLLNIIDEKLDPDFDPNNLPELVIQAPPVGGAQLPPGVEPSAVDDPAVRQAYENAIDKNRRQTEAYNLQHLLRRLEEKASRAIEALENKSYLPVPSDQQELAAALQALRKPERRSALRAALRNC